MSGKKIAILTQYFLPEMGAPQSRLYETALGLKQHGWDVRIITAMPNYPTGKIFENYRKKLSSSESIDGIPVYRYTLYASNSRKRLPRIVSMLSFSLTSLLSGFKLRKFRPDYIFTESPPLTLGVSGLILSKLVGAKHIMNISDIWPLSAYELGALSDGYFYRVLSKLELFLYKRSFACTGQSQQIVSYLQTKGSNRTHLYRNGVHVERFNSNGISKTGNTLRIVYAGLLGVAQGIFDVCRNINFAELGVEFHIYGDGAERKQIAAFLSANPDRGIVLHETVKREDVPATIMHYDITLIPLIKPIYGAVPSKIYEAMAAGLPILFTGGGEGAELVSIHNAGWICAPSDFEGMKKLIKEIVAMPSTDLAAIKANCVAAAKNVFDRKKQVEHLHQFLLQ
jgi:glycosyltransferase involved in cell wall biosynthesis